MTDPFPLRRTPEGEAVHRERRTRQVAHLLRGREITTSKPGCCPQCLQEVPVGSLAIWARGAGVAHIECIAALRREHGELRAAGRTNEQALRDAQIWRAGGDRSYIDYLDGRAEDQLTRQERGY